MYIEVLIYRLVTSLTNNSQAVTAVFFFFLIASVFRVYIVYSIVHLPTRELMCAIKRLSTQSDVGQNLGFSRNARSLTENDFTFRKPWKLRLV